MEFETENLLEKIYTNKFDFYKNYYNSSFLFCFNLVKKDYFSENKSYFNHNVKVYINNSIIKNSDVFYSVLFYFIERILLDPKIDKSYKTEFSSQRFIIDSIESYYSIMATYSFLNEIKCKYIKDENNMLKDFYKNVFMPSRNMSLFPHTCIVGYSSNIKKRNSIINKIQSISMNTIKVYVSDFLGDKILLCFPIKNLLFIDCSKNNLYTIIDFYYFIDGKSFYIYTKNFWSKLWKILDFLPKRA